MRRPDSLGSVAGWSPTMLRTGRFLGTLHWHAGTLSRSNKVASLVRATMSPPDRRSLHSINREFRQQVTRTPRKKVRSTRVQTRLTPDILKVVRRAAEIDERERFYR